MENKELNELAFELAIKSLEHKKQENKTLIIILLSCLFCVLVAFSLITYMNCKRIDRVVDIFEGSTVENVEIDYGDGEFNGNATLGDGNNYGKN